MGEWMLLGLIGNITRCKGTGVEGFDPQEKVIFCASRFGGKSNIQQLWKLLWKEIFNKDSYSTDHNTSRLLITTLMKPNAQDHHVLAGLYWNLPLKGIFSQYVNSKVLWDLINTLKETVQDLNHNTRAGTIYQLVYWFMSGISWQSYPQEIHTLCWLRS